MELHETFPQIFYPRFSYFLAPEGLHLITNPRLCTNLFEKILEYQSGNNQFKVEVSYMEIYNEKVRDLLGGNYYIRR